MFENQRIGDDKQEHDGQLAGLEQGVLGVLVDTRRSKGLGTIEKREISVGPPSTLSGPMSR